MAEKGRLFTGARARFSLEGIKVGYATNVEGSEEIEYAPAEVLDNIEIEEFVPVAYRVSLTCGFFRIVGETLKSKGWFPKVGANTEEHLRNILALGDLVATIEDTQTRKIIATFEQVKIANHNFRIDPRGIVGKNATFAVIRKRDESEI